jgi:hypothetical protein
MEELKDWSTSIGKSISVRVGDGLGDWNRDEGKDSTRGDDEKLMMAFWLRSLGMCSEKADDSVREISYRPHPARSTRMLLVFDGGEGRN